MIGLIFLLHFVGCFICFRSAWARCGSKCTAGLMKALPACVAWGLLGRRLDTGRSHQTHDRTFLFIRCGRGRWGAGMLGKTVERDGSQAYYQAMAEWKGRQGSLASQRQTLFRQTGLQHLPLGGSSGRGTLRTICMGKTVYLQDGETVAGGRRTYIRESILKPRAKIVSGFKPIIAQFQTTQIAEEKQLGAKLIHVYPGALNGHSRTQSQWAHRLGRGTTNFFRWGRNPNLRNGQGQTAHESGICRNTQEILETKTTVRIRGF